MENRKYIAPSEKVCQFLIRSLLKVTEFEEHCQKEFAKRLFDLYEGPKVKIASDEVMDTFPWLYQIGLVTYQSKHHNRLGGYHLFMRRDATSERMKRFLEDPPHVMGEFIRQAHIHPNAENRSRVPVPGSGESLDSLPNISATLERVVGDKEGVTPPVKKRRKCCDNPHIVKSRKTGRRKCKNCGKKLKKKKVDNG